MTSFMDGSGPLGVCMTSYLFVRHDWSNVVMQDSQRYEIPDQTNNPFPSQNIMTSFMDGSGPLGVCMTSYLFVRRDRSNPSPQLLNERKCLFIKSCSTWRWMRRAAHLGSSLSVVSSQLKFLSYSRQVKGQIKSEWIHESINFPK